MSRNKDYQRLLNSKRWKQLRAWKLEQNPLCELCQQEGKVVSAIDVHHRQPVEECRTVAEMEARCFNPLNLMSLCIPHHIALHKDAKSHTKQAHKQRENERLSRWIAKHDRGRSDGDDKNPRGLI